MTKKDFVRLAVALSFTKPQSGEAYGGAVPAEVREQWTRDTQAVANVLATINPRFDRERFLKAAGAL